MHPGLDVRNGGPVYLSNCTSTVMGKLGGLCPVVYKFSKPWPASQ